MKKLSSLVLALAFVMALIPTLPAEAHVLEKDGTIQGVMHLAPAHKPTATEPATFEFFMTDSARTFDPSTYSYTLEVSGEGMATATVPVTVNKGTLTANYIFAAPGEDYIATLTGSSTQVDVPSFTLDYDDIFVLPAGQHENPITNFLGDHGGHALVVALIILAFVIVVIFDRVIEPWIKRRTAGKKS